MAARKIRPVLWEMGRRGTDASRRRSDQFDGGAPRKSDTDARGTEPAALRSNPTHAPSGVVGLRRLPLSAPAAGPPRIRIGKYEFTLGANWKTGVIALAVLIVLTFVIVQLSSPSKTSGGSDVLSVLPGAKPDPAQSEARGSTARGTPSPRSDGGRSGMRDNPREPVSGAGNATGPTPVVAVPPKPNVATEQNLTDITPPRPAEVTPPKPEPATAAEPESRDADVQPFQPERGKRYLMIQYFSSDKLIAARAAREYLTGSGVPCVLVRQGKDIILVASETFDSAERDAAQRRSEDKRAAALRAKVRSLGKNYARTGGGYAFEQCYVTGK